MSYVPDRGPAPRLNVDRHGNPRDYATYEWLLYGRVVDDRSPARIAFLYSRQPSRGDTVRSVVM